jgi:hypothetical protein
VPNKTELLVLAKNMKFLTGLGRAKNVNFWWAKQQNLGIGEKFVFWYTGHEFLDRYGVGEKSQ